MRDVVQNMYSKYPSQETCARYADYTARTRQHELDHTDHTDHADQEYICPEQSRP